MTSPRLLSDLLVDPAVAQSSEPVVFPLAWSSRFTVLGSASELKARQVVAAAVAARSSGGVFLGRKVEPGSVLVVSLEEEMAAVARRLDGFGAHPPEVHLADHLGVEPLRGLQEAIRRSRAGLVVLDSFDALAGALGLTNGDAGAVMRRLVWMARETGAGLLALSEGHDDEAGPDPAMFGAADVLLHLQDVDLAALRGLSPGPAGAAGWPLTLRVRRGVALIAAAENTMGDTDIASADLGPLDHAVLEFIAEHPGGSTNGVKQGVTGRSTAIAMALDRLTETGLIEDRGTRACSAWHCLEGSR